MDIIHSKPHMHIGKFNIINNTSLTVVYSMHKKKQSYKEERSDLQDWNRHFISFTVTITNWLTDTICIYLYSIPTCFRSFFFYIQEQPSYLQFNCWYPFKNVSFCLSYRRTPSRSILELMQFTQFYYLVYFF